MIYEMLLALLTMQPVAENNTAEKSVAETEIRRQIAWPIGCWDCRGWGAIRVLDDGYAIDVDPEGKLQNWGVWQYFDQHTIVIVWMESSLIEFIMKDGDKFMREGLYSFGAGSMVEEVKKIGK